ncbi:hypothetical protein VNO77_01622 [Canavalia gladiata]|uniref:Uncharacterized protein n=1 Tax=Canavalia gladiata TaxID=3824 RepID=A0AAN9R2B2_CANGL
MYGAPLRHSVELWKPHHTSYTPLSLSLFILYISPPFSHLYISNKFSFPKSPLLIFRGGRRKEEQGR